MITPEKKLTAPKGLPHCPQSRRFQAKEKVSGDNTPPTSKPRLHFNPTSHEPLERKPLTQGASPMEGAGPQMEEGVPQTDGNTEKWGPSGAEVAPPLL